MFGVREIVSDVDRKNALGHERLGVTRLLSMLRTEGNL
jgi:hypothetical protein